MFENHLKRIGLSDKEAKVYLTSLQLGKSPANEIAKQAGVNRATTYVILEELRKMGLITSFDRDDKAYFTAETPERLVSLIKKQEQELKEKEDELKKIIPDLLDMFNSTENRPKLKYYEGREGIKALQDDFLRTKSKLIWNITNLDEIYTILPDISTSYSPRRVQKGIRSRYLYVSEKGPDLRIHLEDSIKLRESKHIPYSEFPFKTDITIYDNKVSFQASEGKLVCAVIEDKGIADSMKAIFEYIWEKAPRQK